MNNVHEDAPVVFETRWAMSYLRGPLTREQIKILIDPYGRFDQHRSLRKLHRQQFQQRPQLSQQSTAATSGKPMLPHDIREYFIPYERNKQQVSR